MTERKNGRKVGLYLDADLWKRVRREALDRGLSASGLIELAIGRYLSDPPVQRVNTRVEPLVRERTLEPVDHTY